MSTGEVFSCPVDGWLDNDNPKEPSSRTVSCASSGDLCHLCHNQTNILN